MSEASNTRTPVAFAHPGARPTADAVSAALDELLSLLGEPLSELGEGDEVLIKPNMFQTQPGFAVNADLLAALARRVADHGARPTVAERTANIYEVLRDHPVHRWARVVSLDDLPLRVAAIPAATSLRVPIAVPDLVLDCDYFIGVPQLRTHASVVYSNAMKNLVGLLPGYTTRIVHMAGVDESTVDLNLLRHQDLVVCDGTTVIEGNYPMAGRAREVGFLAASRNAVALDVAVGSIAGFDPGSVAYLRDAHQRGMGPLDLADIELRGTDPDAIRFDMEKAPLEIVAPRPGIHIHADRACPACRRYIAGAMVALRSELLEWDGEMTVLAGPMTTTPPLVGAVVLVGNCLYESRDLGVYIEGCPPRAIQIAGFRYAMGKDVSAHERTQFRVPAGLVHASAVQGG
ncbi:DUF362 domain-containing protein [Catenulispora rubra]|uniref:DUF362 domain-containing protein n=1 Tax=Catenulispora rubra TaxID=280293 RepID=UPI00189215D2|nr:DUF362 domain-containing protein [Catenulispora rubra]